ncbi:MAG: 3-deoxy-8-phosphooctulonate synthase, partial [Planctomycetia bacterium]|nr:3-deoxy-8-phosphooctulonate synthase [Planctomycetia bacterium]
MDKHKVEVGGVTVGGPGAPLFLIAGPCVIESEEMTLEVAEALQDITHRLAVPFIFKSSFDKANRTSIKGFRGPGLAEGLEILKKVRSRIKVPVLSDIHETHQVQEAAKVLDCIQIPAFLCRQTDLIEAAAASQKAVNIKKGQFLAPWDIRQVLEKALATGNRNIMLTERGTSFGYNRLVVDMTAIPGMQEFGYPVVFDATHSVQQPGGMGAATGGNRAMVRHLASAAVAAGCDGL